MDFETRPLTRREAVHARRRNGPSRITIPAGVSPAVRLMFEEMKRQRLTYPEVEERSGVNRVAFKAWRTKNRPSLESLQAVLSVLGWELTPIPNAKILPRELIADITAVANRHEMSLAKTIECLAGILAGVHERLPDAPSTSPSLVDLAPIGGTDMAAA